MYSTSLDSFAACSSRLNRARVFHPIALFHLCVFPCCPLFMQGHVRIEDTAIKANGGHNNIACCMLIEGRTLLRARISRGMRCSSCPTSNRHAPESVLCLLYDIENPLTPRLNLLSRPAVTIGELSDLVRQEYTRPPANVFCTPGICFGVLLQPT